jgi:hypothetical protein
MVGNEKNSILYHFFTFAVLIVYGFVKLIIYQDDDKRIIGINWVWLFETNYLPR